MTKKKTKAEYLTEAQVAKTYEIVKGFNIPDGEGEKRFEPGKSKPKFVTEKDFAPEVWKELVSAGAVVPVEEVENG